MPPSFRRLAGRFHIQRIIGAADVFQHADADDAVVLTAFGDEIAIVDEVNLDQILESQFSMRSWPFSTVLY